MNGPRYRRLVPWVLLGLLLTIACDGAERAGGDDHASPVTVRAVLSKDPASLSLLGKTDRNAEILAVQITDSLVQYDPELNLQPRVAESWEILRGPGTRDLSPPARRTLARRPSGHRRRRRLHREQGARTGGGEPCLGSAVQGAGLRRGAGRANGAGALRRGHAGLARGLAAAAASTPPGRAPTRTCSPGVRAAPGRLRAVPLRRATGRAGDRPRGQRRLLGRPAGHRPSRAQDLPGPAHRLPGAAHRRPGRSSR